MTVSTQESFADMAVALRLAAGKMKIDVDQLDLVGARIGLSEMGMAIAKGELQRHLDLVVAAHLLIKDLVDHETEVRKIAAKPKLRLFSRLVGMLA